MKTSTILLALFSNAGFEQAIATLVSKLQTWATGTGNSNCDLIEAMLNICGEDALTFNADCWAMLCGGKDQVMWVGNICGMAVESQINWSGLGNAGKRSWMTRIIMLALEAPPPRSSLKTPRFTESRPFHPLLHGVSTKTGIPLNNFHLHQQLGVDKDMFNWDPLHLMSWAGFANIWFIIVPIYSQQTKSHRTSKRPRFLHSIPLTGSRASIQPTKAKLAPGMEHGSISRSLKALN